jgi:hypothetical protein
VDESEGGQAEKPDGVEVIEPLKEADHASEGSWGEFSVGRR